MLMCYEHHKVTDDVKNFPVPKLEKIKTDHETRFSSPDRAILQRLTDWTLADEPKQVKNLRHLDEALGWNTSDHDLREEVIHLNEYIELGHRNIQHTVRYTELSPDRFKQFWK